MAAASGPSYPSHVKAILTYGSGQYGLSKLETEHWLASNTTNTVSPGIGKQYTSAENGTLEIVSWKEDFALSERVKKRIQNAAERYKNWEAEFKAAEKINEEKEKKDKEWLGEFEKDVKEFVPNPGGPSIDDMLKNTDDRTRKLVENTIKKSFNAWDDDYTTKDFGKAHTSDNPGKTPSADLDERVKQISDMLEKITKLLLENSDDQ